jgi:hypothetical protein
MKSTVLIALLAASVLPAQSPQPRMSLRPQFPPDIVPPVLTVTGVSGKSVPLVAVTLAKLPQQTIHVTDHDTPVTFQGVRLSDVLALVDLPVGDKFHSSAASYYLQAEAADGYRAVFSWAELDPGIAEKPVYLVLKRDGKELADKEGPFELVVPGEKRNARWVRQLQALRILKAH